MINLGELIVGVGANLKDLRDGLGEARGELDQAGKDFSGKAKAIGGGLLAIGTMAVGSIAGITAFDQEGRKALNRFKSQTGVTKDEAEEFSKAMDNLFGSNMGSYERIGEAMAIVKQNIGGTVEEVEELTNSALVLEDTFGYAVNDQIRAVESSMEAFGVEGDKAFNIIGTLAQNVGDDYDDLLDTFQEYAPQLAEMGYSMEEFALIMQKGAESGAMNFDKVGDVMKELNLRVAGGGKAVKEAFESMGMSYDDVIANINKGGDSAKDQFNEIVQSVSEVQGQAEKKDLIATLFGGPGEDVGNEFFDTLAKTQEEIFETRDVVGQAGEDMYNDLGSAMEGARKNILLATKPIAEALLPMISKGVGMIKDFAESFRAFSEAHPQITKIISIILVLVAVIGMIAGPILLFLGFIPQIVSGISMISAGVGLLNVSMGPLLLTIGAIILAITTIILVWKNWDQIVAFLKEWTAKIGEMFNSFIEWFVEKWTSGLNSVKQWFIDTYNSIIDFVIEWIAKISAMFTAFMSSEQEGWRAWLQFYLDFLIFIWDGIIQYIKIVIDFFKGIFKAFLQVLKGDWRGAWETIQNTFSSTWDRLKTLGREKVGAVVDTIQGVIGGLIGSAKNWGKNLIGNFVDGIRSKIGAVKRAVSNVASKVKNFLGFSSPTKEGPGSNADQWFKNLGDMLADDLNNKVPKILGVAKNLIGSVGQYMDSSGEMSLGFSGAGSSGGNTTNNNSINTGDLYFQNKEDIDYFMRQAGNFVKNTGRRKGVK